MIRAALSGRARHCAPALAPLVLSITLVLALASILVLPPASAAAQSGEASERRVITGTVADSSGGVLPGATVDALVASRVVATATTDDAGRYRLQVPARVPIALRARLAGFADELVDLTGASEPLPRDLVMQVGRVSDTVVVTASRGAESRTRVTESVTVATAEDIRALGSASLADVVRFVPGLAVEATGREGALTALFSRGGESDYNLVLIDGVRANQNGGNFDVSRISASEIERVEVVRGAQSALWGSDAMGSVVQVFTRRAGAADARQVSGSVEGGSFDTWRGDARLTGGAARLVDYHGGIAHRRTDGAFAGRLPDNDAFEQTTFDAGFGTTLGNRASLRSGVRYSHGLGRAVGPIAYGARDTGTVYDSKDFSWHAGVSHALGARYTGTGNVNVFWYEGISADRIADPPSSVFAIVEGSPGALFPNGIRLVRLIPEAEFQALAAAGAAPGPNQYLASTQSFDFPFESFTQLRRPAVRYQGDVTWANGQRLSLGYDWERERRPAQAEPAVLPELTTNNHAFFIQQQLSVQDRWFVTIGARADAKQGYDTYVSPKLSAGGFPVPRQRGAVSSLKVFGNIGRGIKSPGFDQRFGAVYADPNPSLQVERARTADLGVEATFADQRLRGTVIYFNNHYTDQIAYRFGPVGDLVPEFINVDGSKADGWEIEVALQRPLHGLSAAATYALVDTRVVTNLSTSQEYQPGQPLLRRPKHSATIRVGYSAGRVAAHFDTRMVGDRHDNSFLFLTTVPNAARPAFTTDITVNPGYAVSGLGVDVRADSTATIFVRADNVTGRYYEGALGFPGMPRTVMAGVRFTLRR